MNASNLSNKNDTSKKPVELRQLVYRSEISAEFKVADLNQISASSQKNNASLGITGIQIFNGRWFLHMLEGPAEIIEKIYFESIVGDRRHTNLSVLVDRRAYNRNFSHSNFVHRYMDGDREQFVSTMNKSACRSFARELLARPGDGERMIADYLKVTVS